MIISLLLPQQKFHNFPQKCSVLRFFFCMEHVFAIELTLHENLVRSGEFRRKIVSIERTVCWQR